ncbi:pentapeptide repeat-containing protein [Streptomyces geranii]|uniref:pentapeptide repeat-containing protein n=1 Tax=Streptomyces geranii TaxID=2058923 RepID=UPI001E4CDD36|nr:pentapeptide repeat-containing protein [Streptomyces geranii]
MTPLFARTRERQRGLRLWHVWVVLPLAFIAALTVAGGVFYAGWDLLGARGLKAQPRIDSKTLFDLVKLSFGVVAGAGGLVALIVAYRRQRVDEDGALRDATRLHSERFTVAVSQLGDASAAVRLGGVHSLAHLADDAPTRGLRQTCIDVLCAYLRLPYTAESDLPPGDTAARHEYLALQQVRHTVIRLIRDHLRLDLEHTHSWRDYSFAFTSVVFDGGDFTGAHFHGTVSFDGAEFSGGTVDFDGARFSGGTVSFDGAEFSGGTVDFDGARFSGGTVSFDGAEFSGGTVSFSIAEFSGGTVSFRNAQFNGGTVSFRNAQFNGGTVFFHNAQFNGGTVSFRNAQFNGGTVFLGNARFSSGTVSFDGAEFSGGTVSFSIAQFSGGTVSFRNAQFNGGTVFFGGAQFNGGTVPFDGAQFSGGTVDFRIAQFSGGTVFFRNAQFSGGTALFGNAEFSSGTVDFDSAEFNGGTVDFAGALGVAPSGLPSSGGPLPAGVTLADAW